MNIVFSTDNNGVWMCLTATYSVMKNNQNTKITFYILESNLNSENKDYFKKLSLRYDNSTINFVSINKERFNKAKIPRTGLPIQTYYRYLAPDLLPKQSTALYMDIDMLCTGSLAELYSMDIDNYYIAAVPDANVIHPYDAKYKGYLDNIGFNQQGDIYANSGLMLMNLELMRKDNIPKIFIESATVNRSKIIQPKYDTFFVDQTIANFVFRKRVKKIGAKYNSLASLIALGAVKGEPVIIHFAGSQKPFQYMGEKLTRYMDLYRDYYNEMLTAIGTNNIAILGMEKMNSLARVIEKELARVKKEREYIEYARQLLEVRRQTLEVGCNILERENAEIQNSSSWKITRPLRLIGGVVKKVSLHGKTKAIL